MRIESQKQYNCRRIADSICSFVRSFAIVHVYFALMSHQVLVYCSSFREAPKFVCQQAQHNYNTRASTLNGILYVLCLLSWAVCICARCSVDDDKYLLYIHDGRRHSLSNRLKEPKTTEKKPSETRKNNMQRAFCVVNGDCLCLCLSGVSWAISGRAVKGF